MNKVEKLIDDEVNEYRKSQETKENETKEQLFTYLLAGYSLTKFKDWLEKKWDKSDRKKMKKSTAKLEKLVDEINEIVEPGKPKNSSNSLIINALRTLQATLLVMYSSITRNVKR
ncbi:MAG: hypothetical protein V8R01_06590 [Bacilli bacterium]